MLLKWILLLTVISVIQAQFLSRPCTVPRLSHGRTRSRIRSKMIKYICQAGYTLVGNRYSTCKNGQWDTPIPICVRPGCIVPTLKHGLTMPSFEEAWVVFFCMPGYKLVGSPAIYCDGRQWNSTAPTCVDSTLSSNLSCDFESPDLCGWTQDALHDFDWERLNKKTPSSFLYTGPSYDHTYGKDGSGYYMYIESSSRLENDTARLVSPIYESRLAIDGCFKFFYHMFGKHTGGLRVYQKPDTIGLEEMLRLPDSNRQRYILFEQWGNQGDIWYGEVAQLRNFSENFQIVIEGIRGKKFTSDIAIDDVTILQGENCSLAERHITTPTAFLPDSCDGRCIESLRASLKPQLGCACYVGCITEENCCPDFYETCIGNFTDLIGDDSDQSTTTMEPPTEKSVANYTSPITTTTTTVAPKTTTETTLKPVTSTTSTTMKPTFKSTTSTRAVKTSTNTINVTVTVFQKDEIKDTSKYERTVGAFKETTTLTPVITTKKIIRTTSTLASKIVTKQVAKPTTKVLVQKFTTVIPKSTKVLQDTGKINKNQSVEENDKFTQTHHSSAWKTVLITVVALICCAGVMWVVVGSRGARGMAALGYFRGRTRNDPEVRYLHSAANDDD